MSATLMCRRSSSTRRFLLFACALLSCALATSSSSIAGDTRTRRAPAKGNDSLIACADGCFSTTCLRTCIEDERQRGTVRAQLFLARARGEAEEGRLPPDVMLAVREAIDNIELCADRYTDVEASVFDEESYDVCAWGAAYVYLRQTGWGEALSAAEEGREATVAGDITALATGLELVVQVAEATHEAVIAFVELSALGGIAIPVGKEPRTPFGKCIDKRNSNIADCNAAYPDDSSGLEKCYEGVDIAFKECAKKVA